VSVHSCAVRGLRVHNHPIHQGSACACAPKAIFDEQLLDYALKTLLWRRISQRVQECERRKTYDLLSGSRRDNDLQGGFWIEKIVFELVVYGIRIWLRAILAGVQLNEQRRHGRVLIWLQKVYDHGGGFDAIERLFSNCL
jgi:hypothetical protein